MKNKNKPDNLESFFQRVLKDYEEEPDVSFWNNIAPNVPAKPVVKPTSGYQGWVVITAFLCGLLFSVVGHFLQSNTRLISTLNEEISLKNTQISHLEQEVLRLKLANETKVNLPTITNHNTEEIIQHNSAKRNLNASDTKKSYLVSPTEKDLFIKLEIARNKGAVAAAELKFGSQLQPSFLGSNVFVEKDFKNRVITPNFSNLNRLLFDNQLITNSFFIKKDVFKNKKKLEVVDDKPYFRELEILTLAEPTMIAFNSGTPKIDQKKIRKLLQKTRKKTNFGLGEDALTSFLTFSINPVSGLKYNLDGYRPNPSAITESAGISSSWNWSVYGGFETKSKWSVQMGIDYDNLTIVKESSNNIRFKAIEEERINEGYVFAFNQRFEGALGLISVNATIFNHQKNDNQDIENGDLFKLSVRTEQPVQIIRVPIMGGYRFDLSSRFYVMPKIGISPVWKTKDRTQLTTVNTFDDRLSVQNSGIFLTSKITTESLEANFRSEFGFRWRPRWYLIAEPRFKYAKNSLFTYKNLELKDSPFHLMLGIRFNID